MWKPLLKGAVIGAAAVAAGGYTADSATVKTGLASDPSSVVYKGLPYLAGVAVGALGSALLFHSSSK